MEDVDRTAKSIEYQNRELSDKVKYDENQLKERLNELKMMKSENDKAQDIIRELERQTEQEQEEFNRIRMVADQERR